MKKLAIAIIFTLLGNQSVANEEKFADYYNKSLACAAIYHYQLKFLGIANSINPADRFELLIQRIAPVADSWVAIAKKMESVLINGYNYNPDELKHYRFNELRIMSGKVGADLLETEPYEFTLNFFSMSDQCPTIALEIQELVNSLDSQPEERSIDLLGKPKKKM
jgi:hypothetical protein